MTDNPKFVVLEICCEKPVKMPVAEGGEKKKKNVEVI
jgi:hypothetical protein